MSIEALAMQVIGLVTAFLALACVIERVIKKPGEGCNRPQATRNTNRH